MYLFTGENSFALREAKMRWIGEFVKKHGEDNCVRVDGAKASVRDLLDDVSVQPFLAAKRLVVLDGAPSCNAEEVRTLASQIHPDVILLIVDPKLDKRTSGAKEFLKACEVKEYPPLKGKAISDWVVSLAQKRQASFDTSALSLLLEYIGEDQDLLSQEVEKLIIAAHGRVITKEDIEFLCVPTDEGIVWRITDLLSAGHHQEALLYAHRLLDRGGDAYGLWAILLSFLRNVIAVKAAVSAGVTSPSAVAEETGVHPFALRSLLPYAKKTAIEELRQILSWVTQADTDLKTGGLRATDESPQELFGLIDRFILTLPPSA